MGAPDLGSQSALPDARGLGIIRRVFKETRRTGRRYSPPWRQKASEDRRGHRGGDYTSNWNRALKGRNAKDIDDGRGGLKLHVNILPHHVKCKNL